MQWKMLFKVENKNTRKHYKPRVPYGFFCPMGSFSPSFFPRLSSWHLVTSHSSPYLYLQVVECCTLDLFDLAKLGCQHDGLRPWSPRFKVPLAKWAEFKIFAKSSHSAVSSQALWKCLVFSLQMAFACIWTFKILQEKVKSPQPGRRQIKNLTFISLHLGNRRHRHYLSKIYIFLFPTANIHWTSLM